MKQLKIIDGKGQRTEELRGITVQTSGGAPPAWSHLLEYLPARGRVLDYGSWQGLASLWLTVAKPEVDVSFAHHSSARIAQAEENAVASQLELEGEAMFPLRGQWDAIILAGPEQSYALEMFAFQAGACLAPKGILLFIDKYPRTEELGQVFQDVSQLASDANWVITRCSIPRVGAASSLPWRKIRIQLRDLQYQLETLPGNFSPGCLDKGTKAMLEVARIPQGGRVLDLACGYGVVGLCADMLGAGEVIYVDDDLIAIEATRRNLQSLGLKGELVHSHLPNRVEGKFDVILTNPPFHTDYGVAKDFLEFSARRLNPQGWLYLVVKKPDWYVNKIRSLFGGCRVIERDGYYILSSQLRQQSDKKSGAAKTTRKHLRRQQAVGGKKNG